jgi:hypothetical protein
MRRGPIHAVFVAGSVAAISVSTAAQESVPAPPASYRQPAVEPGHAPDDPRFIDAHADRVGLFSTAETHPGGTAFLSNYNLGILQFGYAFSDDVQGAVTTSALFGFAPAGFFDVSMKLNALRDETFRLALVGSITAVTVEDTTSGVRVGGVAQLCFTPSCWTSVSVNLHSFISATSTDYVPVVGSAGLLAHLSELFALIAEPSYALIVGDDDISSVDGFLLTYGIRLTSAHWAFDLTLVKAFGQDVDDDLTTGAFAGGVPLVALTYRTAGEPPGAPDPLR